MVTAEQVVAEVRVLLPTIDLSKATERSVRSQLEAKLGEDLQPFAGQLREAIDQYLIEADLEDGAAEDADIKPQQAAGQKRSAAPSAEQEPAKRLNPTASGGPYVLELTPMRRVTVDKYQGKVMVNIREFYQDASGELKPGKKGLSMVQAQFSALFDGVDRINDAVEAGGAEGFVVDLSATRKVKVDKFKGSLTVDLREYYTKNGELAPGPKGICLPLAQWETLSDNLADVRAAAEALGGGATTTAAASTSKASASAPNAAAESKPAASADVVELSNNRRAVARAYNGKPMLDVREFYEKNGEMLPGYKGCAMNEAQWDAFRELAPAINDAVVSGRKDYNMKLAGTMKKVTVEQYRGSTNISIRDYYEKNGKELPGKKGIALTVPQWNTLYEKVDALHAAFCALK